MRRPTQPCLLLLLLSASFTPLAAQQPVAPLRGRIGFLEPVGVVAPGRVLLLTGGSHWDDRAAHRTDVGEMSLRVGLVPRLELRLSPNSYCSKQVAGLTTQGLVDAAVNLKALVLPPHPGRPTLSASVGSTLPSGVHGFTAERVQPFARLLAEQRLSGRVALQGNLTWHHLAVAGGGRREQLTTTAWLGWQASRRVWLWGEHHVVAPLGALAPDARYLHGGVTVGLDASTSVDLHAGFGLTEVAQGRVVGMGLVQRF